MEVLPFIAIGLYVLPAAIAWSRNVPNRGSVVVINLLLGWSLIGWIVALAMAAKTVPPEMRRPPKMVPTKPPPPLPEMLKPKPPPSSLPS